MTCENCGKTINEGTKFCIHCGKKASQASNQKVDKTSKKSTNYSSIIISIGVFIIVALAVKYFVQNGVSSFFTSNDLEQALVEASQELNKDTPMAIDSITELTTTTVSGTELIYHYKITDGNSYTQSDLDSSLKNNIINQVCTTSETRNLIDMGASLVYTYYNNNGGYIGKITVQPANCK